MKLYMVPLAPNPTKVMLYIAEREALGPQLNIEQVMVNTLKGKHREPEHLARNPLGTLPVLELEDGRFITESLCIIEFLEERYPEGALYAQDPETRALQKNIERIVELRLANPMGFYVHAKKSPVGYPTDPDKAAELQAQFQSGLDIVETMLSDGRPYLAGETVTPADCTVQSAFQFLRFIEEEATANHPYVKAWDERYRDRPTAQAVLKW